MPFKDFNLQPEDYILKKLLLFTITLVLMSCVQAQAADVNTVKATIVKHAIEMGVDPAIALSIAKTEPGYRHAGRHYVLQDDVQDVWFYGTCTGRLQRRTGKCQKVQISSAVWGNKKICQQDYD